MKITTTVMIASALSIISLSPLYAADPSFSPVPAKPQETSCPDPGSITPAIRNLSRNISLALLAADKNQLRASSGFIAQAEQQFDTLMASTPIVSAADQTRMVRLDYQLGKANHFILLPFDDDSGLKGLSALYGAVPKESKVVTMHMVIDGNKVKTAFEQVWQSVAAKDAPTVAATLQDILAMMGNAEITERPNYLKETYDHMRLTDNLLNEGLYGYARFSLKHVKDNLKSYSSPIRNPKQDSQITQLKLNVDILTEKLNQQNPSTLKKTQARVKEWMKQIKELMQKEGDFSYDIVKR